MTPTGSRGVSHVAAPRGDATWERFLDLCDEAAALGLGRLKKDGWIEGLGPGTRLEIHVGEPGSHHVLPVQQLERWIGSIRAFFITL